ncbi:DNA/RNA helicase domain-containing protein [Paraburkholderia fungorum]
MPGIAHRQIMCDSPKIVSSICYADETPIEVTACAYLHNYHSHPADPLRAPKFSTLLEIAPTFSADDIDEFVKFLVDRVGGGDGLEVLRRMEESRYRPSKKLMDYVASVIKNNPEYTLLDKQQVAFDAVMTAARRGVHDRQKQIIIIKGGPGTGKSVLAINLVASLLSNHYSTHYVTGSKAFTETLRKIIGPRGQELFTYTNGYVDAQADSVDVLVTDEAHRIRDVSSNRFTPANKKSGLKQLEEFIAAARVSVFFIDDHQVLRPGEIGSVAYIREYAEKHKCAVYESELETQFRCNGSDAFVRWINTMLGIDDRPRFEWNDHDAFDFKIFQSPEALENAIEDKVQAGATGRLAAGFCWPWSDPNKDGTLRADVVLGNFSRPWNARPDSGRLAAGIPKSSLWAYHPNGINQVGCVYTAQGFEFDYAGIIFGQGLRFDPPQDAWVGDKTKSHDSTVKKSKDDFTRLVKNTYRVLLSRGMKGCYVCFADAETEAYFRSHVAEAMQ